MKNKTINALIAITAFISGLAIGQTDISTINKVTSYIDAGHAQQQAY